jgi:UDP-N-acetylmuramyl pentapeptide synthase
MPEFSPDITVVTAVRNDEEAQKYFAAANRSKATIINICDVPKEFMHHLQNENAVTYGDELPANYYFENTAQNFEGQEGDIVNLDGEHIPIKIKLLGEHNVRPVLMACAVGRFFGMDRAEILKGIEDITPIHGRMSPARGINGSYIIDDSADGTPDSVHYGLRAIYSMDAPARAIVVDNIKDLEGADYDMLSDALVLTDNPPAETPNECVHFFSDSLELMNYLGQRAEENGIILLEIPLPEIIEEYLW